jgi:D-amino-acid dehydrogenase
VLRNFARKVFPGLQTDLPTERIKVWMGHRPSMRDGLPCIGPASGCADVVHAFGHGHVGLTAGAATGRLVADLVSSKPPTIDPGPYSAGRFR